MVNVKKLQIDFGWPKATRAQREAVNVALEDGSWGLYSGRWTDKLENRLRQYFSRTQVRLCSSGTIAVELALRGLGVRAGTEVVLAGYDFPGNFRAIESIGATPVLVDVVPDGWVMDASQLSNAITETTSAIIVSHIHGQVADIASIEEFVRRWNQDNGTKIAVLEDACQAPGAMIGDRRLGSFGDASVLSFGGSKLLSAGRGGAVLTDDKVVLQRMIVHAERGNDAYPLSQLQAAVLAPQLDSLEDFREKRNNNAEKLVSLLSGCEWVTTVQQFVKEAVPNFYKFPWLWRQDGTRDQLVRLLVERGIPVGMGFRGFTKRSARRCRKVGSLLNAEKAANQTMVLSHPALLVAPSEWDQVAEMFKSSLDRLMI